MEELEFNWEQSENADSTKKRVGRSKLTGTVQIEIILDRSGREIEKVFYDDDGQLGKRTFYEHDDDRRPKLTTAFDRTGKLVFRHERGKRPEIFE